jgi:RNA polymerase sigma factor (sigma-70 family)
MTELNEQDLLELYAWNGSEPAFSELVRRHTDLVFSTAIRLVRDPHLAEDVSQRAFVALAQHARKLSGRATIAGWLHLTTRNFAIMTIRTEERRKHREQKAAEIFSETPNGEAAWPNIAAHLDEALSDLNEGDRDIVVLRYLERKTARETAERFGLSEEAAQKRTSRALKRLREALNSRGVAVSVLALGGIISAEAVKAAPAGLAGNFAVAALAGKSAVPSLTGFYFHKVARLLQLKSHPATAGLSLIACLSLGIGGFYLGHSAAVRHNSYIAWQKALDGGGTNTSAEALVNGAVNPRAAISGAANTARTAQAAAPTVSEILSEAAANFRNQDSDPDAYAKGAAAMQSLKPEDAGEALRLLETLRDDKPVFRAMAPLIMKLWAQTDPRAALDYALTRMDRGPRAMSIELLLPVWTRQKPEAAWAWYRQTTDSGKLPSDEGNWVWLPNTVFKEWAANNPAKAIDQLGGMNATQIGSAINGVAEAAALSQYRAGILEAMSRIKDDDQRGRLAIEVANCWGKVDPQAAAEWAAGLAFPNPASRLHATAEAFEKWWDLDPHAAAVWMFTQAPGELVEQFKQLVNPVQMDKVRNAAK